jgi:hypothetical protein
MVLIRELSIVFAPGPCAAVLPWESLVVLMRIPDRSFAEGL